MEPNPDLNEVLTVQPTAQPTGKWQGQPNRESNPGILPLQTDLWQETLGWCPSPLQWERFWALYEGIVTGNRSLNLTRLTTPTDFLEKHLWDSLCGLWPWLTTQPPGWVRPVTRVIDVGTGGGFPGLPGAIARPEWQVTLLDATQKKVRFLTELAPQLHLPTVQGIAERAETLAHQPAHREAYDLALLRAVGPAPVCAEYGLPLVRVGGWVALYRGLWTAAEEKTLKRVAQRLGGAIAAVIPWQTPLTQSTRHCIYLEKQHPTSDAYPRYPGIPTKSPLG